jgi:hypothetical protein
VTLGRHNDTLRVCRAAWLLGVGADVPPTGSRRADARCRPVREDRRGVGVAEGIWFQARLRGTQHARPLVTAGLPGGREGLSVVHAGVRSQRYCRGACVTSAGSVPPPSSSSDSDRDCMDARPDGSRVPRARDRRRLPEWRRLRTDHRYIRVAEAGCVSKGRVAGDGRLVCKRRSVDRARLRAGDRLRAEHPWAQRCLVGWPSCFGQSRTSGLHLSRLEVRSPSTPPSLP